MRPQYLLPLLLLATPAAAMDHGFDPTDPTVQWFDSLTRPDAPADHKDWRCCGKGDAYRIRIDQDAAGEEGDTQGTAVVTDSAAITFPDGEKREPLPNGTVIRFPLSKVTQLKQGNPTNTAWAFLSVWQGKISLVWCIVPLPPGY